LDVDVVFCGGVGRITALLDRACSGEEVVITRHGAPIARLVKAG
jgi:prevent-host-death family protein